MDARFGHLNLMDELEYNIMKKLFMSQTNHMNTYRVTNIYSSYFTGETLVEMIPKNESPCQ